MQNLQYHISDHNKLIKKQPLVSNIILSHNAVEYTKVCIESILNAKTRIPQELIIVDNNSSEETKDYIRKIDAIKYLSAVNLGSASGRNIGFSLSSPSASFVCFLDNDVVVPDYWIDDFVDIMQSDPSIGVAGASSNVRMLKAKEFNEDLRTEWLKFCKENPDLSPTLQLEQFYPKGFLDFASHQRSDPKRKIFGQQMPPDYIPAWCQLIRKGAVSHLLTPYDPEYPLYSAGDIDLSWEIGKKGYKAIYNEKIFVRHFKGQSAIAKNPEKLAKDALLGYARLSKKWSVEIIDFLSSPPTNKYKDLPYDFGGRVRSLVDSFGFFIQIDGEWRLDEEKGKEALLSEN